MPQFDRLTVYHTLLRVPVVPVYYNTDLALTRDILDTCYRAGLRLFEWTNRGDFAHDLFAELSREAAQRWPDLILGAGTILDAPTAALYAQLGANFIVGPTFSADVARLCNRRRLAYLPGCATINEIVQAEEWGVEVVKLFPGDALGPGFVRSLRGPLPRTKIMVTGGVEPTRESLVAWFGAGAVAVGLGSQLIPSDLLADRRFDEIEKRLQRLVALAQELTNGK